MMNMNTTVNVQKEGIQAVDAACAELEYEFQLMRASGTLPKTESIYSPRQAALVSGILTAAYINALHDLKDAYVLQK
ncbi:MAG: hypothetical protein V1725_03235 [archaeon]